MTREAPKNVIGSPGLTRAQPGAKAIRSSTDYTIVADNYTRVDLANLKNGQVFINGKKLKPDQILERAMDKMVEIDQALTGLSGSSDTKGKEALEGARMKFASFVEEKGGSQELSKTPKDFEVAKDRIMNSTNSASDKMKQLKGLEKELDRAIAYTDKSGPKGKLKEMKGKITELKGRLNDKIDSEARDAALSKGIAKKSPEAQMKENIGKIRNTSLPLKERKEAAEAVKTQLEDRLRDPKPGDSQQDLLTKISGMNTIIKNIQAEIDSRG